MRRALGCTAAGGGVFILLLLAGVARADDAPPFIGGDGRSIRPTEIPEAEDRSRRDAPSGPTIEHRSILLDLPRLSLPSTGSQGFLSEVTLDEPAPGNVWRQYRGLQGVVVRRLFGFYRRFFNDSIQERWDKGDDSMFELESRIKRFYEAEADRQQGGRWWDRTWRQSLVPQRGGVPEDPWMVVEGQEVELIRLGPIAFTNELRFRVKGASLYFGEDQLRVQRETRRAVETVHGRRARQDANLARDDAAGVPEGDAIRSERRLEAGLAFEEDAMVEVERVSPRIKKKQPLRTADGRIKTPRGSILTGDGWSLSGRGHVQLRAPDEGMMSAFNLVTAQLDLNFYPGRERQLFGTLSLKFKTRPRYDFHVVTVELEVVRW